VTPLLKVAAVAFVKKVAGGQMIAVQATILFAMVATTMARQLVVVMVTPKSQQPGSPPQSKMPRAGAFPTRASVPPKCSGTDVMPRSRAHL